jgi:hypothetical protein
VSEAPGNPTLPTDGAGNIVDPVTGEPLGSLLDLPGVVATTPPAMTGITVGGTTVNLTPKAWSLIAFGALALVGVLMMRED